MHKQWHNKELQCIWQTGLARLDSILQLNGRELLSHAGKISHEKALQKSGAEFEKYKVVEKQTQIEQSLKEMEEDIKKLKNPKQ